MKLENVASSRNALGSVFCCRNSRYGPNQETSEVSVETYPNNSNENRRFLRNMRGGRFV